MPLVLAGSAVLAHAASAASCSRRLLARVPLRDDSGFLSIPASIAGQPVRLMIDTGSDTGLITPQAARGFGLMTDPRARILLRGTGGDGRPAAIARVPGLAVGSLRLGDVSMPVGALPAVPRLTPPVAGFLGGDVLSRFDLDIDVPGAAFALYDASGVSLACAARPEWRDGNGGFTTIPLDASGARLSLAATLDGHSIRVLLDTGARSRIVSRASALRIGVAAIALDADPGGINSGVDLHEQVYHWHVFDSLTLGGETTRSPVLTVAPLSEPFDMLLGTDWLQTREIWVSYAARQMFVRRRDRLAGATR